MAVAALGSRLDDALGIFDRAGTGAPQAFPLALVNRLTWPMTFPGIWGGRERIEVGPAGRALGWSPADADAAAALARPARDDLRRRRAQPRPLTSGDQGLQRLPGHVRFLRIPASWRVPVATAQPGLVEVAHFTDAACPWAYNFEPVLRTLEARYGDQLSVRTVMIGLSESYKDYVKRGYTAEGPPSRDGASAGAGCRWPRSPDRPYGTGPACRLVKAAQRQSDLHGEAVLPPLRFGWFTTDLVMDEETALREVLESVDGLDVERALADARRRRSRPPTSATARRRATRRGSRSSSAERRPATAPTATPRRASSCAPRGASSSRRGISRSRPSTCSS